MSEGGRPTDAPEKKAWYKRVPWWGWVAIVAALLVIDGINTLINPEQTGADPASTTPSISAPPIPSTSSPTYESVPTPTPTPESTPTPTPEPTETATQTVSLAETVWATVEANFPGGITSGSPLFGVTDVEDISTTTIRVYIQEILSEDGREEVARHVYNMGAWDNTDLGVVVVRDASGRDSNHYRHDFAYLPQ